MPNSHRHLHGRRLFKVEKFIGEANVARDNDSHQNEDREAVVKTVYKTMDPTFEGEVAGYTTVKKNDEKPTPARKDDPQTTPKQDPKTTTTLKKVVPTTTPKPTPTTSKKSNDDDKDKDRAQSRPTTTSEKTSSIPSVIRVPTESASLDSVLATASEERSLPTTLVRPTEAATSLALADSTPTTEVSTSKAAEGSSPGAKAGIAFGVLGGLFLVGLLVFLAFNRRRKRAEHERLAKDDEKLNGPIGGGVAAVGPASGAAMLADNMSVKTDPKAPRISLRPVTQFLPNWGNEEKNAGKGAGIALTTPAATSAPVTTSRAPGGSAWDRPTTSQSIDAANPFGSQAERVPSPIQEESSMLSQNSIPNEKTPANDPLTANGPPIAAAAVGAAAGAGAAAAMTRKASMRRNGPQELDLTLPTIQLDPVPASPAGTEFSVSSINPGSADAPSAGAAAIAAAGGPANSAVYRVQLDFIPTLEDELGLKAGDLVRLLHEYDDGWALVIRLDRSRQGVAPRTCLSTRPVKPRPGQNGPRPGPPVNPAGPPRGPPRGPPHGPPHHPGQRPMTPQGRPASPAGRPMTPNGARSQSPMGRPMSPAGHPGIRSQSPGPRSQSPGPHPGPPGGRPMSPGPRSQSPGPRNGPPGGRPQSPNGMNRRNSPPGPSPMNPAQAPRQGPPTGPVGRKPVPGQAY